MKKNLYDKESFVRFLIALTLMATIYACSSGNNETENAYTKEQAQQVYNQMRGTYTGKVYYNSISHNVTAFIGDNFEVKGLPLRPLLQPFYTNQSLLEEAVLSAMAQDVSFTAPTETLNINNYQVLLVMKPSDLIFTATDSEGTHRLIATMQATAYKSMSYNGLTINIEVTELNYDGKNYPFTTEFINYFIDNAVKQN